MNRAAALAYVQAEYADIALEAGIDTTPLLSAYNTAIDQSLRGLEYPEDELGTTDVPDSQVTAYLALLDYFILSRFLRVFALRTDVSVSGAISASQSQMFRQLQKLRDMAEKRLAGLGYSPTQAFTSGRFTLDFLEPSQAGGGMG